MRKVLYIISVIALLLLIAFIRIKANPPLSSGGVTNYVDAPNKRLVEITNTGLANITVVKVLVNDEDPKKAELGISRSNHLVLGANVENDPNISFHNLLEIPVAPKKNGTPNYGIMVYGYKQPTVITIKYTYLGIPFSLKISVNFLNHQ